MCDLFDTTRYLRVILIRNLISHLQLYCVLTADLIPPLSLTEMRYKTFSAESLG